MAVSVVDLREAFRNPGPAELELMARYAMLPESPQRERAFRAFAETGLPHRRMEAWKWSDMRAALGQLAAQPTAEQDALAPTNAATIQFSASGLTLPQTPPRGVKLHILAEPQALADAEEVPLAAMTAALAGRKTSADMLVIEVTEVADRPLHLIFRGDADETNFARLTVIVRANAALDLFESHLGGAGFSSYLSEIKIESEGKLNRTVLQRSTRDEVQAVTALVQLRANAHYTQTQLAFGAKLARLETRVQHEEDDSHATLNAAYLCADGFHADLTSHIRHGALRGVTRQTTKGAVLSGGVGIFQGKFHVPRTIGQFTDADMQHQALLLEEGAQVFAKPELEIYADDVECAHGNTSGALDETQLFYLRQRGIPLAQARALLTEAFIAEAFESAPDMIEADLRAAAHAFLAGVS